MKIKILLDDPYILNIFGKSLLIRSIKPQFLCLCSFRKGLDHIKPNISGSYLATNTIYLLVLKISISYQYVFYNLKHVRFKSIMLTPVTYQITCAGYTHFFCRLRFSIYDLNKSHFVREFRLTS